MATKNEDEMSISEARKRLSNLPLEFVDDPRCITLTRYSEPVLALMPWEFYDSMMATMEIMADPELADKLRQSIKEIEEGQPTITIDELRDELGL
jgi:PHD/YefM family antitoxin component YafN of YafNO toxin-antitoxin module